jgi:hypothetical protein
MKTQIFKLIMLSLLLGSFTISQAQGTYSDSEYYKELEKEYQEQMIKDEEEEIARWDQIHKAASDNAVGWADYTVGGGVGFGWSDSDGNSQTSYCVSAEFSAKVLGKDQNPKGAGYLSAFGAYHNASSDSFDEKIAKFGVGFSYFDRITAHNEVQLIYSTKVSLETGSRDFSGFEEDLSGYAISVYSGVNFKINNRVSVGVEVPILTYRSRTFEANGAEFKTDSFSAAINKDNPIMACFRINLARLDKAIDALEEEED